MKTIKFADLPALKAPLLGGAFIGVTTLPDGTNHAVVLLADKPPKRLPWKQATAWVYRRNFTLKGPTLRDALLKGQS